MPRYDTATMKSACKKSAAAKKRKARPHPTTSDPDYSPDEMEFMMAMEAYKARTGHRFPT